ncbi:MAG: hypothetical protein HGA27_00645 [Peptococcaceae bacterium]|nr:hypothetical protein [Peptococcaceae bacterium]
MNLRFSMIILTLLVFFAFYSSIKTNPSPWTLEYKQSLIENSSEGKNISTLKYNAHLSHNEYQYFKNTTIQANLSARYKDRLFGEKTNPVIKAGTMRKRDVFSLEKTLAFDNQGLAVNEISSPDEIIESFTVTWEQDNRVFKQRIPIK